MWGSKASQKLIVTLGIGTPINQSFFAVQASTRGAPRRARTWLWRSIMTQINQSFCCKGFLTLGTKVSQELIVTRGIGTPINHSFYCAGFDMWGATKRASYTWHKPQINQSLGGRLWHLGRKGKPGPNCDSGIRILINHSSCCAGFDTWGSKASQDLIVTSGIGRKLIRLYFAGFDTWGAKGAGTWLWRGIRTPINQSFISVHTLTCGAPKRARAWYLNLP